jgi:hypothetical protein
VENSDWAARTRVAAEWTPHGGRRVLGGYWVDTGAADVHQILTTDPDGEIKWWQLPTVGSQARVREIMIRMIINMLLLVQQNSFTQ